MKHLSIVLLPCILFGTIFFDDNFEDSLLVGWATKGKVQCVVDPEPNKYWLDEPINPDFVRIQHHGIVSMVIFDDSDEKIANAIHSFPVIPVSTEYMVEFYFHFYEKHKNTFKNFNLYKPQVWVEGRGLQADIVLKLHVVKGDSIPLTVIDDNGPHSNVFFLKPDTIYTFDYGNVYHIPQWEDSTDFPIERWYRFQIDKVNGDSVVLYINGKWIGTYESISGNNKPDQFLLGTENAAIENGVGIYDDFIITTPPQGKHPRLLFNASELPGLRARKNDSISTIQRTYQTYWDKITEESNHWDTSRTIYGRDFPYNEPPYDSILDLQGWWLSLDAKRTLQRFETIGLRWIIGELDPNNPERPDTSFFNYLRGTMNSFANWNFWMKPCEYRGLILKHNTVYEFCIAFGYDILFDSLTNYEKMSFQNALLSQGIVNGYLLWRTRGFDDPSVPFYPGHPQWVSGMIGFVALVLDDDSLRNYYADFSEAIIESLYTGAQETDMIPVFGPDGEYAHGSLSYGACNLTFLTLFWEANRRVRGHDIFQHITYRNRFENYPIFRLYTLCPGGSHEFRSGNDVWVLSPWHQTFCFVTNQQNNQGQWFYKRIYSYPLSEWHNDDQYHGLNFLFFDDNLVPQRPFFTIGKNFGNFWIGMRTGLGLETPSGVTDDNEIAMIFDAYGKVPIHGHQSRNNFVVGTNSAWIINEHYGMRKRVQSLYHNTIVVDSIWNNGDGNYGQRSNSRGDLKGFYNDNNYCYCANGVAEGCYVRMKKFIRKVIFTKEGYVVMKDEVESSNPYAPRAYLWLVHVNPDQIYGDSLIEKTNKFHIKFFSPADREINSWPSNTPPNYPSYGVYVTNAIPAVTTEFLSVIITKRSGYPWPPSIRKIDGTTMLGAGINEQSVILYGKGQTGNISNVTYRIYHSFILGLKNILSDLEHEHRYYVYVNNQYTTSFRSTDCGTGYFNITSSFSENSITVTDVPPE